MIQRSAACSVGRSSAGRPNGPIAKETSARAVAAKKKTATIATRRRSSCVASLAQIAQARGEHAHRRRLPAPSSIRSSGSTKSRSSLEASRTGPPRPGRRDGAENRLAALEVEADHRLVEDEDRRVEEAGEGDPQPLLHAGRVLLDAAPRMASSASPTSERRRTRSSGRRRGRPPCERTGGSRRPSARRRARGPVPPSRRRGAARTRERGSPSRSIRTRPAVGRTSPARIFRRVVLPLPFLPATATRPRDAENERPEKSGAPEKDLPRFSAAIVVVGTAEATIPPGAREGRRRA